MADEVSPAPILASLDHRQKSLLAAVPRTLQGAFTWEKLRQSVILALESNPTLCKCTPRSFYTALLDIVSKGLDPNPKTGQAFLVPFYSSKAKSYEATVIIGQLGKLELAYRHPRVLRIITEVIRRNDVYSFNLADGSLSHTYDLWMTEEQRGPMIGAYCRIWLTGTPHPITELMPAGDFEKIKGAVLEKSKKPWNKEGKLSPAYVQWESEMFRRSVLSRGLKRAPKSSELLAVITMEASVQARRDSGEFIDIEPTTTTIATRPTGDDALGLGGPSDATPQLTDGQPARDLEEADAEAAERQREARVPVERTPEQTENSGGPPERPFNYDDDDAPE